MSMKIAIFNGLPFHFEMFGYILHFCNVHGHTLTIYTQDDTHKWLEFYMTLFPTFQWKSCSRFISEYTAYDFILVTTDDDRMFPLHTATNVICIDHRFNVRRPSIDPFFHIATRPFATNYRKWALPCYPIVQTVKDKIALMQRDSVHVIVLGFNEYNISRINRLTSKHKITLHFISRQVNKASLTSLKSKFHVIIYENISTSNMIDIINKSKYVICDVHKNEDHTNGISMSGCIPMAFSTLSTLIISDTNNSLFKFTSVKTFALHSDTPIVLTDTIDETAITAVYNEREVLMSMFRDHMHEIMHAPTRKPLQITSLSDPWTFRIS
jgi:hypothetical protein